MENLKVIILAAGQGKRLNQEKQDLPKVLRQAAGRPLLDWVLGNLAFVDPADITLVVGYQAEAVRQAMGSQYQYVLQAEQLGTGHATAAAAAAHAGFTGDVLVIYGDMPLFKQTTYQELVDCHRRTGADCTLLTARTSAPLDFGRIIRGADGSFLGIVEQKDCTPEQRRINELNPGVYVFRSQRLFEILRQLRNDNAQGEYYLTDAPLLLQKAGRRISTITIEDDSQIRGVNTPEDLVICEKILKERQL